MPDPRPTPHPDPSRLAFHRYLAETGRYADDTDPRTHCPNCRGSHGFKLVCAIATLVTSRLGDTPL